MFLVGNRRILTSWFSIACLETLLYSLYLVHCHILLSGYPFLLWGRWPLLMVVVLSFLLRWGLQWRLKLKHLLFIVYFISIIIYSVIHCIIIFLFCVDLLSIVIHFLSTSEWRTSFFYENKWKWICILYGYWSPELYPW